MLLTAHTWPWRGSLAAHAKDISWMSRFSVSRQDAEAHAMTWMSASGTRAATCSRMSVGRLDQPAWSPRCLLAHWSPGLPFILLGGQAAKAICSAAHKIHREALKISQNAEDRQEGRVDRHRLSAPAAEPISCAGDSGDAFSAFVAAPLEGATPFTCPAVLLLSALCCRYAQLT